MYRRQGILKKYDQILRRNEKSSLDNKTHKKSNSDKRPTVAVEILNVHLQPIR